MDTENQIPKYEGFFCIDEEFSTTRCLSKERPLIRSKTENQFETVLFLPRHKGRKGEGGLRTEGYFKKPFLKAPLITVITVVFNDKQLIEETIQSVINQTYQNIEYIIIDGGSTDGTLEIIRKYEKMIDYWVSETDRGIYDAMNKGIDIALGEWINFMNAGDCFFDSKVAHNIFCENNFENVGVIFGNHEVKYYNKKKIKKSGTVKNLWKGSQFCHQSVFVASPLHKNNKFNIDNKIGADFEFFYNAFQNKTYFKKVEIVVCSILPGGLSDIKRLDSILGWWNVIQNTKISYCYYASIIILEVTKSIIKNLYKICRRRIR